VTKAGRFSSRHPNMQNLPRAPELRECIIAEEGFVLLCADYSQIELRVAAHKYRDIAMTGVFARGEDIHDASAAMICGISINEVTKEQRDRAKAVSFGVLYGQDAQGLADSAFFRFKVELTETQAQIAIDDFFAAYPDLHQGLLLNREISRRRGFIRIDPSGRLVRAEWEGGYLSKQQTNNLPIQGGAADLMLLAIKLVDRAFRKAGIRGSLILTVHDELLAEIHQDDAVRAKQIMHDTMVLAFEISFPDAPTTGLLEVGIGANWRAAKEAAKKEKSPSEQPAKQLATGRS
jgi:DNA polymerase-1